MLLAVRVTRWLLRIAITASYIMRLLNSRHLTLEEFWDYKKTIRYAILSHRWEKEEVTFRDIQNPLQAANLAGFTKIQNSCKRALNDGYDYIWVDTCCINKESSAELTEAINSMYRWYKAAAVCYVYLSDVDAAEVSRDGESKIMESLWFERGWTLQELLAPKNVLFFDQDWAFLGTKHSLSESLTRCTGIDETILRGNESVFNRSIAQRMSWAAGRKTTRDEDIAYSLLGIFDVNMPMLYGEGEKAFLRLQAEIIRQSDDHSIFAWPIQHDAQPGLLADNPAAFAECGYIRAIVPRIGHSSYALTNRGLSTKFMAAPFTTDTYIVPLDCVDERFVENYDPDEVRLGMFLRRLDEDDQYARVRYGNETFIHLKASIWEHQLWKPVSRFSTVKAIEVNIQQAHTAIRLNPFKDRVHGFRIASSQLFERDSSGKNLFEIFTEHWDARNHIMSSRPGRYGNVGSLDVSRQRRDIDGMKLGFDFEYNPVCSLARWNIRSDRSPIFGRSGNLSSHRRNFTADEKSKMHPREVESHWRDWFDDVGWDEIHLEEAYELGTCGLWTLRGDRVNGLDVRLGDGHLRIVRGMIDDKYVWEVYLTEPKQGEVPLDNNFLITPE